MPIQKKNYLQNIREQFQNFVIRYGDTTASEIDISIQPRHKISDANINCIAEQLVLSDYEKQVLVFAAALQYDEVTQAIAARLQTAFVLSLSFTNLFFEKIAHWIVPASPLRFWKLLQQPNSTLDRSQPIQFYENVLLYTIGHAAVSEELKERIEEIPTQEASLTLDADLQKKLTQHFQQSDIISPAQIICNDQDQAQQVAILFAQIRKKGLLSFSLLELNTEDNNEKEAYRWIAREMVLNNSVLWVSCDAVFTKKDENALRIYTHFITKLIQQFPNDIVVSGSHSLASLEYPVKPFYLPKYCFVKQGLLWKEMLPHNTAFTDTFLKALSFQFKTTYEQTKSIAAHCNLHSDMENIESKLWNLCREYLRKSDLSQVELIVSDTKMDEVILESEIKSSLEDVLLHARCRHEIFEKWIHSGAIRKSLIVLFEGPSGTGKTTIAKAIANELQLDILKVDLSQTVSKYIGETEKNIDKVFDLASQTGAILLFDEADAVFTKRTEVKDSHDANANKTVSFLLQKMETHDGICLLTTNYKSSLDQAFTRRIDHIIHFENPNRLERLRIWENLFPETILVDQDIDYHELSMYRLTGAEIKAVGLGASYVARQEDKSITIDVLLNRIKREFRKNDKPLRRD